MSVIYKQGALLDLMLTDGSKITGIIQCCDNNEIVIKKEDNELEKLTEEILVNALYLYIGYPTQPSEIQVPSFVKANGSIVSFSKGTGFVEDHGVKKLIHLGSFLIDDEMRDLAQNNPSLLVGREVLYVTQKKKNTPIDIALLLAVDTIDNILDKIILLASQGNVAAAIAFCQLLQKDERLSEDKDLNDFLARLTSPDIESDAVDFYHAILTQEQQEHAIREKCLIPLGRIVDINSKGGHIIDVVSHEELYFFRQQLMGSLSEMSDSELIEQPVVYTTTRSKDGKGYQARSILMPLKYMDAYYMAEDMHYDTPSHPLNACDILRIIMAQYDDPDIRETFDDWNRNPNVRDNLWTISTPPPYTGQPVTFILNETPKTLGVELKRLGSHTHGQMSEITPPEPPLIILKNLPVQARKQLESEALFRFVEEQPQQDATDDIGEKTSFDFDISQETIEKCDGAYNVVQTGEGPKKVKDLLQRALDEGSKGLKLPKEGVGTERLHIFRRSLGDVELAMSGAPNNAVAIQLRHELMQLVARYDDCCHKAPQGVQLMGRLSTSNGNRIRDYRFSEEIPFEESDIVDRNYNHRRMGDELMYSIYADERGRIHARFVHRAQAEGDLMALAQYWVIKGNIEKAWGVAMNILDSNADSEQARILAEQLSSLVSSSTRRGRQQPVKNDLMAQARELVKQRKLQEAVDCYQNALSQSRDKMRSADCIRSIIGLYSELLNKAEQNRLGEIKAAYRLFGVKYLEGTDNDGYWLREHDDLENVDCLIQYYTDMELTTSLVNAYNEKIVLLSKLPDVNGEESKSEKIARARSAIAWAYIMNNEKYDEARVLTDMALKGSSSENTMARCCDAVLKERNDKKTINLSKNISFSIHKLKSERNDDIDRRYWQTEYTRYNGGADQKRELGVECYMELSNIIYRSLQTGQDDDNRRSLMISLIHYLMAVLSKTQEQYRKEKTRWQIPQSWNEAKRMCDCCLTQLLSRCLAEGPMWKHWTDLRLLSMLSRDVAYKLCTILFHLNKNTIIKVLGNTGFGFREDLENVDLQCFANKFNDWRGDAYHQYYQLLRERTRRVTSDLGVCADFLKNDLRFESWMQQTDNALVNALHLQLASLLSDYNNADSSRKRIIATGKINDCITRWREGIEKNPTVLSKSIFDIMLKRIQGIMTNSKIRLLNPDLEVNTLSVSQVNSDNTLLLEIEVVNKELRSKPMANCSLTILNTDEVIPLVSPYTYHDSSRVFGGEKLIYLIRAKLSSPLQPDEQKRNIRLRLSYTFLEENKRYDWNFECSFPVRPYTTETYTIKNSYDIGTVAKNKSEFYGRDVKVHDVVSVIDSPSGMPHYFIYGQKRSGKSSILYHIQQDLLAMDKYLCVKDLDFSEWDNIHSEECIYYNLLSYIDETVQDYNDRARKAGMPVLPERILPDEASISFRTFVKYMENLNEDILRTDGWRWKKIVLFIDEFTTIFQWYRDKNSNIDLDGFFRRWKSLQKKGLFSAVLIGQDVLRSILKVAAGNDLAGYKLMKLDYLQPEDARRIVVDPIIRSTGNQNIFLGNAVDRILYYSASSAYYTKWICHELIDYINTSRLDVITEADVEESVLRAMEGNTRNKTELNVLFDPLEFSGRTTMESDFTQEENRLVLRKVAQGELADRDNGCLRSTIHFENGPDEERVNAILNELVELDVLVEENNYYKLKVKLYLLWIRKNEQKSGND